MKNIWYVPVVALLLTVHYLLGSAIIARLSPTYDEPLHLAAGYSYITGHKYYLNIYDHPPLAEMFAALPLLSMKPVLLTQHPSWSNYRQYSFANLFLYQNRVDPERMLNAGRRMILLLSCLLGLAVFLWTKELYGVLPGLFTLFIYTFTSSILAHGTLVTTDLVVTCFMFLGLYAFWRWTQKPSAVNAALMALATGLALVSKFSAVVILGMCGIMLFFLLYRKKLKLPPATIAAQAAVFFAVLFAVILVVYRFDSVGLFFEGFQRTVLRLNLGRSAFLAGNYSVTGWKYYFLYTLLTKTSVPSLIFLAASLFCLRRPGKNELLFLVFPAALYFAIASFSKVQIGHRHILPVYPLLIVVSGALVNRLKGRGWKTIALSVLLAAGLGWHAWSCVRAQPWQISYFNEFVGDAGYRKLTDSNIDWGQGLKELGNWYREQKAGGIVLDYFGTGDPHYYGIKYLPVGFIDNLDPPERAGDPVVFGQGKLIFAVSVTNLMATYYAQKDVFTWLLAQKPVFIAGKSIFVYDLTGSPEAAARLREILYGKENKS